MFLQNLEESTTTAMQPFFGILGAPAAVIYLLNDFLKVKVINISNLSSLRESETCFILLFCIEKFVDIKLSVYVPKR